MGAQVFHAQRVVPPLSSGIKSPIQRLTCACPIANFTPQAPALAWLRVRLNGQTPRGAYLGR